MSTEIKMSELGAAANLNVLDKIPLSQGVGSRNATLAQLKAFLVGLLQPGTYINPTIVINGDGQISSITTTTLVLSQNVVLDFPSTSTTNDISFTLTGAEVGDAVVVGVPVACQIPGLIYTGYVSAADTVVVRATAISGGPHDPPSGTFKIRILK